MDVLNFSLAEVKFNNQQLKLYIICIISNAFVYLSKICRLSDGAKNKKKKNSEKILTFYRRQLFLGSCRIMAILSWLSQHLSAHFEAMFHPTCWLLMIKYHAANLPTIQFPEEVQVLVACFFSQLQSKSDHRTCRIIAKVEVTSGKTVLEKWSSLIIIYDNNS